jgi:hypothetical protein
MEHPKKIGDTTTLAVLLALDAAGCPLFVPFGENTRTDVIVERERRLLRVQCKTGRLRRGAVVFSPCSTYGHHRNPRTARRDYVGAIDYFAVFCPETDRVYLVPIDDVAGRTSCTLRVDTPRNNQRRKIRMASDYEIAVVRVDATRAPGASAGAGRSSA